MTEKLCSTILALRSEGYSTPDICQQLGLDSDTVIQILLQRQGAEIPAPVQRFLAQTAERQARGGGDRLMGEIIRVLTLGERPGKLPILTFPALADALKGNTVLSPSRDTLRRQLVRQGLTFTSYLEKVLGSSSLSKSLAGITTSSRTLLYVVSHRVFRGDDASTRTAATLIAGITPFNRIALLAKHQSRLSPGMLWEFLEGLLALHPNRQVVIIAKSEGAYRSIWSRLRASQSGRLHYFLSKNG